MELVNLVDGQSFTQGSLLSRVHFERRKSILDKKL